MAKTVRRRAKKAPAKKKVAKRPATKTASRKTTTTRAPSKRASSKTGKKRPARVAAAKSTTKSRAGTRGKSKAAGRPMVVGKHGFVDGSDSAKIAELLVKGGTSKAEICKAVEKAIGKKTSSGTVRVTAGRVSGVLNHMVRRGYTVKESFKLVAPK